MKIEGISYWMLIHNGKAISSLQHYGEFRHSLADLVECPFSEAHPIFEHSDLKEGESITPILMEYYNKLVSNNQYFPGPYGDWMKITDFKINGNKYTSIDLIGQKAWYKATTAADLGIFIKNNDIYYFIGIVRGSPPAKDTPALIGGIIDTCEEMESGIFAAIREANEEAGLDLRYDCKEEDLLVDYTIESLDVKIKNFRNVNPTLLLTPGKIRYVTTIKTPEMERLPNGLKRVYKVSAYSLFIDFDAMGKNVVLNEELLRKVFKAGDDAKELFIKEVTDVFTKNHYMFSPDFGFPHHFELFKLMVHNIKENIKE